MFGRDKLEGKIGSEGRFVIPICFNAEDRARIVINQDTYEERQEKDEGQKATTNTHSARLPFAITRYVLPVPCVRLERLGVVRPFCISFHADYAKGYQHLLTSPSQFGRLTSQDNHNLSLVRTCETAACCTACAAHRRLCSCWAVSSSCAWQGVQTITTRHANHGWICFPCSAQTGKRQYEQRSSVCFWHA